MVAHLGLRTHKLLYEDIDLGDIIAEICSAWEKAECHEEVANQSQRTYFYLYWKLKFSGFSYIYIYDLKHWKI